MRNVLVFFGGTGVERDVSVITGVLTLNSVDKKHYNPVPVYVAGDGVWYTGESLRDIEFYKEIDYKKLTRVTLLVGTNALYKIKGKKLCSMFAVSSVINCLHGERGEDGSLAGFINLCKIPFASPPLLPSAVAMDKSATKRLLKGLGVKTLSCVTVKSGERLDEIGASLSYPVIVKPACLGSSIGIAQANDAQQLRYTVANALRYGERAVIEKCLSNFIEINCAAYANENGKIIVSECERPFAKSEILSFDDKYKNGSRQFPADIPEEISDKIKSITEQVYDRMQCEGIIRIDFMLADGKIYLNEINTVPGSLAYYLFTDTLKGFSGILTSLIKASERKYAVRSTFSVKYHSNVLNLKGSKGGKNK